MFRGLRIYAAGFVLGALSSIALFFLARDLYLSLLRLLAAKAGAQTAAVGSLPLMIILNNLLASFVGAYLGYLLARLFLYTDPPPSQSSARLLKALDGRLAGADPRGLRFYLPLYLLPLFSLLFNGFILGGFLGLYLSDLGQYAARLYPHAILEIPAIVLSGSIGLTLAEGSIGSLEGPGLRNALDRGARSALPMYVLASLLLVAAGFMEA
ncbi:MAG: stage II sporulation protein M [Euryarchaeota archaeon]|nr:stage II sporulation protein M [Euryarchaeota archaeon]